jgi:hypothetical protein
VIVATLLSSGYMMYLLQYLQSHLNRCSAIRFQYLGLLFQQCKT